MSGFQSKMETWVGDDFVGFGDDFVGIVGWGLARVSGIGKSGVEVDVSGRRCSGVVFVLRWWGG